MTSKQTKEWTLNEIVKQLEYCEFQTKDTLHELENNAAFIALKKLSELDKPENGIIMMVDYCAECKMYYHAGNCYESFCYHADFPRDKDGKYISLSETIDVYEKIHESCPYRKEKPK